MKEEKAQHKLIQFLETLRIRLSQWAAKRSRWQLIGLAVGAPMTLLILLVSTMWVGTRLGWYGELPDQEELLAIENDQAAQIYATDGTLLGKYFVENRSSVPLDSISPYVVQALISTEDSRFFEHQGIDLRALGRVLWRSVLKRDRSGGGGSTISQQLAKNLYPRRNYRQFSLVKNKLREMAIAGRLESAYDKQELLQLYLNTVPFGENVYGIQVAAQRFFSLDAAQLGPEQAAVLIGLLKANTSYNPRLYPEASRQRRDVVLGLMARKNFLTVQEKDSLSGLELELQYKPESADQGLATYLRARMQVELEDFFSDFRGSDGRSFDLYRDGLRIYTTIDAKLQAMAEAAVADEMPGLQQGLARDWSGRREAPWEDDFQAYLANSDAYTSRQARGLTAEEIDADLRKSKSMNLYDGQSGQVVDTVMRPIDSLRHYYVMLHAGLLASEPNTGIVRAWVGGVDHRFAPYDHVGSRRQIGSTIKPLVYATALERGMLPCEYTPAERFTYADYNNYDPRNPDGQYEGVYSMKGGLARSINTVAVNIAVRTGLDTVQELVNRLGIEQGVSPIPSLALGTAEANLLEMNQAYSAFASGGRRPDRLHYLDRIETANGDTLVVFKTPQEEFAFERVLDEETAKLTTFLMAHVVNSGTAARLRSRYGLTGALAGKTGTTQNQSDGWFVGFTPRLVVSSWVGASYPAVHFRSLSRGSATATALPIWGNFMRRVARDREVRQYTGGRFAELDEMTIALLQCPDYLEELPIEIDFADLLEREINPQTFIDIMERKPQRRNESDDHYIRRLERELRRIERQEDREKKRREFWSETLFGKKGDN
ncbi:MAG: transglycosylase domain-containing protein [Bacteroidota bacterium]